MYMYLYEYVSVQQNHACFKSISLIKLYMCRWLQWSEYMTFVLDIDFYGTLNLQHYFAIILSKVNKASVVHELTNKHNAVEYIH